MSMHLVGPYLTTSNYSKRKNIKFKSAEHKARYLAELAAKEKIIKKLNANAAAPKPKVKKLTQEAPAAKMLDKHGITSGACVRPGEKTYSGERKLIGIATMHKSNMVPVFAKQDAEDIARMRR